MNVQQPTEGDPLSTPLIQIILGSTRQGRNGEKVAHWFRDIAAKRDDIRVELVDLSDYALPLFDEPVSPKQRIGQHPEIHRWANKISEADGYVIVTPEYNHGYPAALKSALDHLFYEWNDKPVAFVGYGGPGAGIRAVEQLRQVVVELLMHPTRNQVMLPMVFTAFDDAGNIRDESLNDAADLLLDELAPWAELLQSRRRVEPAAQAS